MDTLARVAAGVVAGSLLAVSAPLSASAAPPDQWWSDIFNLDQVHQATEGKGATVCMIDGGINADVPEFDGADLQLKSSVTKKGELVPAKSSPSAFYTAHGTSMSALIIGQGKGTGPGGSGIAGMAPKATVAYYDADSDPSTLKLDDSDYNLLINQGLDDGCKIFSISITHATVNLPTLQRLNEDNAVVLWGGPNNSSDSEFDGGLIIGASDRDSKAWTDDKQPFRPDVVAPGVDIISGANRGTATNPRWVSDYTNSGSSDATAITAGVLALVSSKYPDATGNQLIQSLIHSVGGDEYWGSRKDWGWGPVSMKDMLARDPSGWPDVNPMLMNRQEIYDTFPESAWKDPNAPATSQDQEKADTSRAQTAASSQSDDGLPMWVWPAGAVVLIGAAGTAIFTRRRSTSSTTTTRAGA